MGIRALGNPRASYNAVFKETASLKDAAASPGEGFAATGGTTNTPGNGYKYHTFLYGTQDNFVVTAGKGDIEVLVVAGGGGGSNGGGNTGGGGGGGGVRNLTFEVGPGTFPISVGRGGKSRAYNSPHPRGEGQPSSIGSEGDYFFVFATGGGASGSYPPNVPGLPGGSGGGGMSDSVSWGGSTVASPDGKSPTVQGYPGAVSSAGPSSGGGGGSGQAGGNGPGADATEGKGGNGAPFPAFAYPLVGLSPLTPYSPTNDQYGGGGGGSSSPGTPSYPDSNFIPGGDGGGGKGANRYGPSGPNFVGPSGRGVNGLGGGGGGTCAGGAEYTGPGGSGVIIIRYLA